MVDYSAGTISNLNLLLGIFDLISAWQRLSDEEVNVVTR